jgi:hypothetical protein
MVQLARGRDYPMVLSGERGLDTETGPEGPALLGQSGGRYWIRTSDPADVNRVL